MVGSFYFEYRKGAENENGIFAELQGGGRASAQGSGSAVLKEELEKFRTDNEKGVDIDGRHYTGYEATQMQRSLERTIRAQKRRVMVDETAGLKTQYERTEVAGFGEKALAHQAKSGIIKKGNELSFVIGRSLGAMAKNYDIVDKQTGIIYRFVKGTRVRNAAVFAGYKGVEPLRPEVIEGLIAEYGGSADKWQHAKGIGALDVDGEEIEAEVHWFQEETVGKVKFKIKEWLYG